MTKNIILLTDSYKLTHHLQYDGNITKLYSYGEPRKGGKYKRVCFFGMQYIIQENFLQGVTNEMIQEAEETCFETFGTTKYFNKAVWERVRDLGYLPIKIKAIPEGTVAEEDNVFFTMESTEPWFATSMSSQETVLLQTWYPTSIATRSMYIKESIKPFFDKTSDIGDLVLPYAVLDFGFRGSTSVESAALGGAAYLLHFEGSDNEIANKLIRDYYGYKGRLKSVYATEHSTATSFGKGRELEYLLHQLYTVETDKIVSIVIDSYDADNFIQNVVSNQEVVQKIKERTGRTVFRDDSGVPLRNMLKHSDMLSSTFGLDINNKGYKVIADNVGLLQADGNNENSIPELYEHYTKRGWSAENINCGTGGGLLQADITRDTNRWAFKASYGERDGKQFDIQKSPASDMTKKSKSGMLKLHKTGKSYMTVSSSNNTPEQFAGYIDSLETVLENGEFKKDTFENILSRINKKSKFDN